MKAADTAESGTVLAKTPIIWQVIIAETTTVATSQHSDARSASQSEHIPLMNCNDLGEARCEAWSCGRKACWYDLGLRVPDHFNFSQPNAIFAAVSGRFVQYMTP